ncbi:MAG: replication-associated recombination protein A [Phycisphaerales bacterium]|jgi:putative ATPase|nr:replication-associated recombination protein A [Phycisphaerales bacterium]
MSDLFEQQKRDAIAANAPLAVQLRPVTLDEILGQDHFLGPGKLLRRMLEAGNVTSLVFYGPPGTGKTTLASVVANYSDCEFHTLNAASTSVKQVREIIERAKTTLASSGQRTVLFIDELHRFNRAQQDVLLGDVENGVILLIGATTENPFFTINTPLLSRSTIFEFHSLTPEDIVALLRRAISDEERGLGRFNIDYTDEALEHIATISDGDARRALTALEVGIRSQIAQAGRDDITVQFDLDIAQESIQTKALQYDKTGDGHYDTISAFIKSMRGSDPDATVYWLAKMLVAGEDPRFIARRIAITASEDVGNADPRAITVAESCFQLVERLGMPECRITLAQAAIYMATAPKSNASYSAINAAIADVKAKRTDPVPRHLRNAPHPGMKKEFGNAEGYQYSHSFEGGVSPDQDYLGVDTTYYAPTERGYEKHITAYLEWVAAMQNPDESDEA